jgi:hypothetical protein
MAIYKITNITHTLGKRIPKNNSTIDIEYIENMVKKNVELKPKNTLYLSINGLPLSIHKLRAMKLISVVEVNDKELKYAMEKENTKHMKNLGSDSKKVVEPKKESTPIVVDASDDIKTTKVQKLKRGNTQKKGGE